VSFHCSSTKEMHSVSIATCERLKYIRNIFHVRMFRGGSCSGVRIFLPSVCPITHSTHSKFTHTNTHSLSLALFPPTPSKIQATSIGKVDISTGFICLVRMSCCWQVASYSSVMFRPRMYFCSFSNSSSFQYFVFRICKMFSVFTVLYSAD